MQIFVDFAAKVSSSGYSFKTSVYFNCTLQLLNIFLTQKLLMLNRVPYVLELSGESMNYCLYSIKTRYVHNLVASCIMDYVSVENYSN